MQTCRHVHLLSFTIPVQLYLHAAFFVLHCTADEKSRYSIMDGKQRLASLLTFMTGDANFGGLNWSKWVATQHLIGCCVLVCMFWWSVLETSGTNALSLSILLAMCVWLVRERCAWSHNHTCAADRLTQVVFKLSHLV